MPPLTDAEIKSDPDIVLRYWLKTTHSRIYGPRDVFEWELHVDVRGNVSIRNWAVSGVAAPLPTDFRVISETLENIKKDEDLTDIETARLPDAIVIEKMLFEMYKMQKGVYPTRAQFRAFTKAVSELDTSGRDPLLRR